LKRHSSIVWDPGRFAGFLRGKDARRSGSPSLPHPISEGVSRRASLSLTPYYWCGGFIEATFTKLGERKTFPLKNLEGLEPEQKTRNRIINQYKLPHRFGLPHRLRLYERMKEQGRGSDFTARGQVFRSHSNGSNWPRKRTGK